MLGNNFLISTYNSPFTSISSTLPLSHHLTNKKDLSLIMNQDMDDGTLNPPVTDTPVTHPVMQQVNFCHPQHPKTWNAKSRLWTSFAVEQIKI
jgi:hypothetical protein